MKSIHLLILACSMLHFSVHAQMESITLDQQWQFRRFGDTQWMKAKVPGCVHTDLLTNNAIPDPFIDTNEAAVQWVENEDWEYRTTFHLHKNQLNSDFIDLNFGGLDTYADVYLNDSLILSSTNMFRAYKVPVKTLLKSGDNLLFIHFYSPVKRANEVGEQFTVPLPSDERVYIRKAQYQFGWDWGPRLVTSGIWQPITLVFNDKLKIKFVDFYTEQNPDYQFPVHIDLAYEALGRMHYEVEVKELTTGKTCYSWSYRDQLPTVEQINFNFHAPEVWMPYALGSQNIYAFELKITHNKRIYYQQVFKTGFSNIQLHQEADASGKSFYFTANGKKVFINGANFIPAHSFPTEASDERYRDILIEAKRMHINMIRVWGGGIYEQDIFYDLCDSLGIMVWQDFMFACAMYPNDVTEYPEFQQQITRLKNHPCLALWCGNNEIDEGWNNWGWQKQLKYNDDDSAYVASLNEKLFRLVIPEYLHSNAGAYQSYHPSSPTYGWGRKESLTSGDAHYWGVWWGKQPFDIYNKKVPRFMSEYGFQGIPSYHSWEKCINSDNLYLGSPAFKVHQKHPVGYETIDEYMKRDYGTPSDLQSYIYISQLLQADGMRVAIEAHRRNMPYCMGTMFWQLNDCWPVTSWSVQDFYGNRKAAWYTVESCYRDVIISVLQEGDELQTWLVNNDTTDRKLQLTYSLLTTSGVTIRNQTLPVTLKANTSMLYSTLGVEWFLNGNAKENCILWLSLSEEDKVIAERMHTFVRPGAVSYKKADIAISIDGDVITLTSPVFARQVYLYSDDTELRLSNNFVDLLPNTPKQISLQDISEGTIPDVSKLKVLCLNNLKLN
ncbi:MAG TPA: hypothetical protein PLM27_00795 [Chitinophagales bacterium]|nr:hypothetical protein [Chitinophagales bacterium]